MNNIFEIISLGIIALFMVLGLLIWRIGEAVNDKLDRDDEPDLS